MTKLIVFYAIILQLYISFVLGNIMFVTNLFPPGVYISNISSGSTTLNLTSVIPDNIQLRQPVAVDCDSRTSTLYWSDVQTSSIERYSFVNKQHETLVSFQSGVVDGLVVDGIENKLYWTSSDEKRIEVIHLDGRNRSILFGKELGNPRAIKIDTTNGYLYWTDWGLATAIIERAKLEDPSTRTSIVTTNLLFPNGLVLSVPNGKMYWCDAGTDQIEEANLDGTERRIIISIAKKHPFGLEMYGNYLYWTDWTPGDIHRVAIKTGISSRVSGDKRLTKPGGLHIYKETFDGDDYDEAESTCDADHQTRYSRQNCLTMTCIAQKILGRDKTSNECVIKWTWMDESDLSTYNGKVCKMIPINNLLDSTDKCTTFSNYEAKFNPTSSGVYCVVLTGTDTADNIKKERRCFIFDNQSEISLSDDSFIDVTMTDKVVKYGKNSEVGQQKNNKHIKPQFHNKLHVEKGMLLAVIKIDNVIELACDSDASTEGRSPSAIHNVNGIVKFHYAVTKGDVREDEQKWKSLPNDLYVCQTI
ncbi:uncharacterized protein [Antedon mediterranea]|uniref:uncharacterized protein n=1 Tax=Antedon mediterranea TaxID=105859 RepID=UPI003AF8D9AF